MIDRDAVLKIVTRDRVYNGSSFRVVSTQELIDAIRAIPAADARAAQIEGLSDPITVHANMLRGTIAKPTVEQIIHLYGVDALVKAMAPLIAREADPVNRPMMTDLMVDPEGLPDMEMEYDHRAGADDE